MTREFASREWLTHSVFECRRKRLSSVYWRGLRCLGQEVKVVGLSRSGGRREEKEKDGGGGKYMCELWFV